MHAFGRTMLVAFFVVGTLGMVTKPCQAVLSASGAIELFSTPPDLRTGAFESETQIALMPEQGQVLLLAPLPVDRVSAGLVDEENDYESLFLPTGTRVSSYLLHFDRVGEHADLLELTGSVTFDEFIVGVILTAPTLLATDSVLGVSGTFFETNTFRGIDVPPLFPPRDTVTISADRHTLTVDWFNSVVIDEVRVITVNSQPVPEPVTAALGLLSLVALTASLRRRHRLMHCTS